MKSLKTLSLFFLLLVVLGASTSCSGNVVTLQEGLPYYPEPDFSGEVKTLKAEDLENNAYVIEETEAYIAIRIFDDKGNGEEFFIKLSDLPQETQTAVTEKAANEGESKGIWTRLKEFNMKYPVLSILIVLLWFIIVAGYWVYERWITANRLATGTVEVTFSDGWSGYVAINIRYAFEENPLQTVRAIVTKELEGQLIGSVRALFASEAATLLGEEYPKLQAYGSKLSRRNAPPEIEELKTFMLHEWGIILKGVDAVVSPSGDLLAHVQREKEKAAGGQEGAAVKEFAEGLDMRPQQALPHYVELMKARTGQTLTAVLAQVGSDAMPLLQEWFASRDASTRQGGGD